MTHNNMDSGLAARIGLAEQQRCSLIQKQVLSSSSSIVDQLNVTRSLRSKNQSILKASPVINHNKINNNSRTGTTILDHDDATRRNNVKSRNHCRHLINSSSSSLLSTTSTVRNRKRLVEGGPLMVMSGSSTNIKSLSWLFAARSSSSSICSNSISKQPCKRAAMMLLCTTLLLVLLASQSLAAMDLQQALKNLSITPNVVDIGSGSETIKLTLNNNVVNPGDRVPVKNFKEFRHNQINWAPNAIDARHLIILLDLDRRGIGSNQSQIYNQFTSINVPGNDMNSGQIITAFEPPVVPCNPSTKHRMLLLVFHQNQMIDIQDVFNLAASSGKTKNRENFDLRGLVRKFELTVVAANAFYALGEVNGVCSTASGNQLTPLGWPYLILISLAAYHYIGKLRR